MKKLFSIIVLILTAFMLQSCSYYANWFVDKINDEIPNPAHHLTVAKSLTTRAGYIIVEQDGEFYAINAARYHRKYYQWKYGDDGWKTILDYYHNWSFKVEHIYGNKYRGPLGWTYEQSEGSPKDLEKLGYLKQALEWENMRDHLVGKFALSAERAGELSHLYQGWKMIDNKRALTDRDVKALSMKTLGLSPNDVEAMYLEENEDFIEKAAKVNGITPEHFKELMRLFME
jgi:hypothetical protein